MVFALKLLGMRSHSMEELRRKLRKKGFEEESTGQVIEQLCMKGLLDDRDFGEQMIGSRTKRKPSGKMKLGAELRRKGVPESMIVELLREVDTGALCMQAAERKFALLHGPSEASRKKKLESFLRNRGFAWQEIRETLERYFPGIGNREDSC